uniref:DNA excision repair protein ERCC-1 n=1 Tax=Melopsittacus undulatus TaxID=13146 RepID=A0A8V5GZC5_MELUD
HWLGAAAAALPLAGSCRAALPLAGSCPPIGWELLQLLSHWLGSTQSCYPIGWEPPSCYRIGWEQLQLPSHWLGSTQSCPPIGWELLLLPSHWLGSTQSCPPIVLRFIRNVPWEYGDTVADYVLGQSSCALFLSLRYHHLHPDYIHQRLRELGRGFVLRVLLLQVDVKDPQRALMDLAKICVLSDCTLLLAWSPEEAARYLETFKAFEQKPPDLLRERRERGFMSDCLTSIKAVNRTDALSLLSTFGSLAAMAAASKEDLSLCPGVGPQKAKRLFDVLHEPFLQTPK